MKTQYREWIHNYYGADFVNISVLEELVTKQHLSKNFYNYIYSNYKNNSFKNNLLPLIYFKVLVKKYPKKKPCWCLSKLKFIDCHFNRDKKSPLSNEEIFKFQKKFFSEGLCLHRNVDSCKSPTSIQSHSISRKKSLSAIAENNHVFGMKLEFKGKMEFKKIGLRQASTFAGFCEKHDSELFASFEKYDFEKTKKQFFDLCYRALCIEHYHMISIKNFMLNTKKYLDNNLDLVQQIEFQMAANSYVKFYEIGIKNSSNNKIRLEKNFLEHNHEDNLQHYIFELEEGYPKFLSCTCVNLEFDLNGNRLQDLSKIDIIPKSLFINCVSFDNKGYFILSWFNENYEYGLKIIDSIINEIHLIENKLFSLCFLYVHNTYVSPNWYENLSSRQKEELKEIQDFWNDRDTFTPDLIKENLNSIKVKNYYPFIASTA